MSYRKGGPGLYIVPEANFLIPDATMFAKSDNFERDCNNVIKSLGSGNRRLSTIDVEDVIAMEPSGNITEGTALRKWLHMFMRFLHDLGVCRSYPVIAGYRTDPELTLEEGLDYMMSRLLPKPSSMSLGPIDKIPIDAVRGVFPLWVRAIAATGALRGTLRDRLRKAAGHIGWKISQKQAISDAERSFFLMMCDPTDPRCWSADYNGADGVLDPTAKVGCIDAVQKEVLEALSLWMECTDAGPFTRYGVLQSNTNIEHLLMCFGPVQSSLSYQLGYSFKFGMFDELRIADMLAVLPWTPEDQLDAARERVLGIAHRELGSRMHVPVIAALPRDVSQNGVRESWDHPSVTIELPFNQSSITPVGFGFQSGWRQRFVHAKHLESPTQMLQDMALTAPRTGEGITSTMDLTSHAMIDLDRSTKLLGGMNPKKLDEVKDFDETIWLPLGGRQIVAKVVNVRRMYSGRGSTMFFPPFREFVTAPLSWLHRENPDAENFIASELNLTNEAKAQALRCIRLSHNYAELSRLLSPSQLPLSKEGLMRLCRAQVGQ